MKIIEIIPSLNTGGGEKFVVDLSNELASLGHEVTIVTLYDLSKTDILQSFVKSNVNISSLSKKKGMDLKCMWKLFRHISLNKPDFVHIHLGAITYILISAILFRKTKYFATIHSEAKREAGTGLSKWIRFFLFRMKLVSPITISEESEKSFRSFYRCSSFTIHNGSSNHFIDESYTQQFLKYRQNVEYLFLHAGRIHSVKNQIMLLKSFTRLIQQGVSARLLIAGRVDDLKLFEELETYFSDNIIYIGEQQDIRSIMSICDAFCLSSTMEGMPITIIEAFSVGCIPIVTPVGGCVNMIRNRENGFISDLVSEDSYYNSLAEFINSDELELNNIMANIKQEFCKNYSINICAKKLIEYFQL